jgi:hypothetical protein
MVTSGYSGTPLPRKLGIKEGTRVLLLTAPAGFTLGLLDSTADVRTRAAGTPFDVILAFCHDRKAVERRFVELPVRTATAGALWIAWPKKSSGVTTDLDENVVRDIGLDAGLVDVKVCAVDETWSGLKFVRRLRDR